MPLSLCRRLTLASRSPSRSRATWTAPVACSARSPTWSWSVRNFGTDLRPPPPYSLGGVDVEVSSGRLYTVALPSLPTSMMRPCFLSSLTALSTEPRFAPSQSVRSETAPFSCSRRAPKIRDSRLMACSLSSESSSTSWRSTRTLSSENVNQTSKVFMSLVKVAFLWRIRTTSVSELVSGGLGAPVTPSGLDVLYTPIRTPRGPDNPRLSRPLLGGLLEQESHLTPSEKRYGCGGTE